MAVSPIATGITNVGFDTGISEWILTAGPLAQGSWRSSGGRTSGGCVQLYAPGAPSDDSLNNLTIQSAAYFEVVPGQSITANWWARMIEGSDGTQAQAALLWFDTNGVYLGNSSGPSKWKYQVGSNYIQVPITASAQLAGVKYVIPALWLNGAHNSRTYADDFSWNYTPPVPDTPVIYPPTHSATATLSFFRNGTWRFGWAHSPGTEPPSIHTVAGATPSAPGYINNSSGAGAQYVSNSLVSATVGDNYNIQYIASDATNIVAEGVVGNTLTLRARPGSYEFVNGAPIGTQLNATRTLSLVLADALANYDLTGRGAATNVRIVARLAVHARATYRPTGAQLGADLQYLQAEIKWPIEVDTGPYPIDSAGTYRARLIHPLNSGNNTPFNYGLRLAFQPNGRCSVYAGSCAWGQINAPSYSPTSPGASIVTYNVPWSVIDSFKVISGASMAGLQVRVTVARFVNVFGSSDNEGYNQADVFNHTSTINIHTDVDHKFNIQDDNNDANNTLLQDWTPVTADVNVYAMLCTRLREFDSLQTDVILYIQVRNATTLAIVGQGRVPLSLFLDDGSAWSRTATKS